MAQSKSTSLWSARTWCLKPRVRTIRLAGIHSARQQSNQGMHIWNEDPRLRCRTCRCKTLRFINWVGPRIYLPKLTMQNLPSVPTQDVERSIHVFHLSIADIPRISELPFPYFFSLQSRLSTGFLKRFVILQELRQQSYVPWGEHPLILDGRLCGFCMPLLLQDISKILARMLWFYPSWSIYNIRLTFDCQLPSCLSSFCLLIYLLGSLHTMQWVDLYFTRERGVSMWCSQVSTINTGLGQYWIQRLTCDFWRWWKITCS